MDLVVDVPGPGVAVFEQLDAVRRALGQLLSTRDFVAQLRDEQLVAAVTGLAECRDRLEAVSARLAGEVALRSAAQLGSQGLAQRTGFRTAEQLIKDVARLTGREATSAVRAGRLLTGGRDGTAHEPWLDPVVHALTAGNISVGATEAIRSGLGLPNSAVSVEQLRAAAVVLCEQARVLDIDRLRANARALRDDLDADGIAIREEERREQRSLRVFTASNGMGKLIWTMDPETFMSVKDLFDRATSPKLGGVRFGGEGSSAASEPILADPRTAEQLASDTFLQQLRAGADADSSSLLGSGAPVVKVTTTVRCRTAARGYGYLEGHPDPVSINTVERLACAGSELDVSFDEAGRLIDATREHRLYSRRQREALAVRDGGCLFPRCSRPPSSCEAHHVKYWARDRGKTEVENGVLLCRHHHLLVHNNGWRIEVDAANERWLIPPHNVDSDRAPISMPSKSQALRQLERERVA